MMPRISPIIDVAPAKAGAHPEMVVQSGNLSGWIPAFAGMTPCLWKMELAP